MSSAQIPPSKDPSTAAVPMTPSPSNRNRTPATPKTPKPDKLPWPSCHTTKFQDWKVDQILEEFGMTMNDWNFLDAQVLHPSFHANFEMTMTRDNLIKDSPVFSGKKWDDLVLDNLHQICKETVEYCIKNNASFGKRFHNLKSSDRIEQHNERKWLVRLFDSWFTKKWNDKRRQAAKGPRKRSAIVTCSDCGGELVCFRCHGMDVNVFPIFCIR